LHAILFNLDAVGEAPRDGLEVIEKIRKIRNDVVLAAFTRSNQRTIPLKASQAGTDEFFLFPINYHELEIVLSRAIEKRVLELEGRRLMQQVESKAVFYGLLAPAQCRRFIKPSKRGRSRRVLCGPAPYALLKKTICQNGRDRNQWLIF
jgi:DNA-binding NarL/FixJ family response regulator